MSLLGIYITYEFKNIKTKFLEAGYTIRLVDSIIRKFQTTMDAEGSFIIPPTLFDKDKPFILLEIPICEKKEINLTILFKNSIILQIENILFRLKGL